MKKINWGIIGLGNIAQSFSEGFHNCDNARLLAVSSNKNEKLDQYKNNFKLEREYLFNNYEDLIKCDDIDIVYIALPNNLHFEWILKCIEKNKNILIEKPAVSNLNEAKRIEKEIIDRNLFFSEGYMYRYYPQIKKIIEILKTDQLGKLISMKTTFSNDLLFKKKFFIFKKKRKINSDNRLFNKDLGGGSILDLGCYTISFTFLIASLIKDLDLKNFKLKNIKKEIGSTGVDIEAEADLIFENGFSSKIKSSFQDNQKDTVIIGEKGSLLIKDVWHGAHLIEKKIGIEKIKIINQESANLYSYQIENISRSLLKNKKKTSFPGLTIDDTILNTKVLESWINA
tara:strand:- start:509 stop:1534 length:1026 start_codon:yes stop_codon:yes gene_type:complete